MKTPIVFVSLFLLYVFSNSFVRVEKRIPYKQEEVNISLESIIPNGITVDEIAAVELIDQDECSSIYKITTKENVIIYQVVAIVITHVLPEAIKYTCDKYFTEKEFCSSVRDIASAIVELVVSKKLNKISKFWSARIDSESGIGSLSTKTKAEAKRGQVGFKESNTYGHIPWSPPVIRPIKNLGNRY